MGNSLQIRAEAAFRLAHAARLCPNWGQALAAANALDPLRTDPHPHIRRLALRPDTVDPPPLVA